MVRVAQSAGSVHELVLGLVVHIRAVAGPGDSSALLPAKLSDIQLRHLGTLAAQGGLPLHRASVVLVVERLPLGVLSQVSAPGASFVCVGHCEIGDA